MFSWDGSLNFDIAELDCESFCCPSFCCLTPPAPDLQQGTAVSQQLADRSQPQVAMPPPPIQHQTSWEQNNLSSCNALL